MTTPDPVEVAARARCKRDAVTRCACKDPKECWAWDGFVDEVLDDIAAIEADGFRIVEREPTREQWAASGNAQMGKDISLHHDAVSNLVWSAMFDAARKWGSP